MFVHASFICAISVDSTLMIRDFQLLTYNIYLQNISKLIYYYAFCFF